MTIKFEVLKQKFENRMNKERSIERSIWVHLKPRHNWEVGLTIDQIRDLIIKEKLRKYTKQRIYSAISDINKFGSKWNLYIRSDYGYIDQEDGKRKEHRYFTPYNPSDIEREFKKLEDKKEVADLKENSLTYHERVTIPKEQEFEELREITH